MTADLPSPPATVLRAAGGLRLLTWPALEASGARAAATACAGGVSSGPYASLNLSLSVGADPPALIAAPARPTPGPRAQLGPEAPQPATGACGPAAGEFAGQHQRPGPAAARWPLARGAPNRHALREAGVPEAQIHTTDLTTGD